MQRAEVLAHQGGARGAYCVSLLRRQDRSTPRVSRNQLIDVGPIDGAAKQPTGSDTVGVETQAVDPARQMTKPLDMEEDDVHTVSLQLTPLL